LRSGFIKTSDQNLSSMNKLLLLKTTFFSQIIYNTTSCFLLVFLFILTLSSCTFYKTQELSIHSESLVKTHQLKTTVVVHDDLEDYEYILFNFSVENDSLKGIVDEAPKVKRHSPYKRSFRKNKVSAYSPISIMHIYSSSKEISQVEFGMTTVGRAYLVGFN
jgi:hypothetical protein